MQISNFMDFMCDFSGEDGGTDFVSSAASVKEPRFKMRLSCKELC